MIGRAPAMASLTASQVLGRQIKLGAAAEQIVKEARLPTPATVSDRLRAKKAFHASWAADMDKRLDAIDAIEAKALPVIEREIHERELTAQAVENDALAMAKLAEDIKRSNSGDPTVTSGQSVNGSAEGNGAGGEAKITDGGSHGQNHNLAP
jgi:hypothetical protein